MMSRQGAESSIILEEHLEQVEQADKLGLDYYFVAEHHGRGEFNSTPSPNCFISAASQRTRRIRLGPLVLVVPLYHPVRILEEVAMLDHLTSGRLEVGLGYGTGPRELLTYGVDPGRKLEMLLEAFGLMKQAWSQGGVSHQGEWYKSVDAGVPVALPLQKPHPPLWYPCNGPGPIPWAAENNMAIATLTTFDNYRARLREMFDLYKSSWKPSDKKLARPPLSFSSIIYVSETDRKALEEATEDIRRFWRIWFGTSSKINVDPEAKRRLESLVNYTFDSDKERKVIVGSCETVASHLASIFHDTGADCFLGEFSFGYLPQKKVLSSMELFAKEVIPMLHKKAQVQNKLSPSSP
ncbi:MAG: LLM class flavin-dependent oxidoreductase [Thaumarchaeota archaeon]|nr:LLM class flavin-dependent oxidoreductase [Nitrososphaerota archaeon]